MMLVGKLKEIWRYPVKSLGGSTVESAHVHQHGIAGDRGWALIDTHTGDICSAKQISSLLNLSARYLLDPSDSVAYRDEIPQVAIQLPDGRELVSPQEQVAAISELTGRKLILHSLEPPQNIDHYRMSKPPSKEFMKALTDMLEKENPGLANDDQDSRSMRMACSCPPGTYFDAFPLHLLTTASLKHMTEKSDEPFDRRRFRPNLLLETESSTEGLPEFDWVGRSLRIGKVLLKVKSRTVRCAMPTHEQAHHGLRPNRKIGKSLNQITDRFLGVYLNVQREGPIYTGDEVELLD